MAAIIPTRKDIRKAISEGLKSFPDVEDLKPEQVLIVENVVLKKDGLQLCLLDSVKG